MSRFRFLVGALVLALSMACGAVHADLIKQGSAFNRTVLLIASSDHTTGLTGQAGSVTVIASKNGGVEATITPTVTEIGHGRYSLAFTGTHTNTLGDFDYTVTATGGDPADYHDQIVAFDPADASLLGLTGVGTAASQTSILSRLGTPAGASVSVDIAAVAASSAAAVWAATTRTLSANVTVGGYATGMSPKDQVINLVIPGENGLTFGQIVYTSFLQTAGKFGAPTRSTSAPWTISVPFNRASDGVTVWTYTTTYTDSTFSKTLSRTYSIGTLPNP